MAVDHDIFMRIIKERRSIRRFKPDPVEGAKIDMLLEAARWAPSAGNAQPWEFVVITDKWTIQGLKTVMTGVMGNMKEGPLLILLCTDKNRETAWTGYDTGCSLQNILLCAHSLGLGACAIGGFDEEMIAGLLELPENFTPCLFITAGYPEKSVEAPERRSLDDIVLKEVAEDE